MTIQFYSTKGEHGNFSNFARFTVKYEGTVYKTSEHAFQAAKFLDKKYQRKIMEADGPGEAARLGRDRKIPIRKDWEAVKYGIMRQIVLCKFTQHDCLKKELLETGDEKIVEHTENDAIWADGGDGSGKNWLGLILMEVRDILRASITPLNQSSV